MDQPQHMNTKAITWIWKIALHLHFIWFVKSSIKAVKLIPLPQRNLTIGATMKVKICGGYLRPKGSTCHSYSFPFHRNRRNFLTLALMGTWRKASLRFNPAHREPFWNYFLTVLTSSIQKYTWWTYSLNFFRFRVGLHLSGTLGFGYCKVWADILSLY